MTGMEWMHSNSPTRGQALAEEFKRLNTEIDSKWIRYVDRTITSEEKALLEFVRANADIIAKALNPHTSADNPNSAIPD